MSNENTSIHDFDLNLICDYYASVERQGPGSPEITKRALEFIDPLGEEARVLDIGCGTGGQTMVLAQHTAANIIGIDLFQRFIDIFNANAAKLGLSSRVKGEQGSMDALPYKEESFDLIWSEGAIYNIGFERGLKEWRKFLKKDGFIAVSEACWFTNERPKEIQDFWLEEYTGIDTIPNKQQQMQDAGYLPLASFMLPEECWIEHFYAPQLKAQEDFLKKNAGNKAAEGFIGYERHQESLYMKYKEYYGYAFFIGKKLGE